jgi:hypothetical protein
MSGQGHGIIINLSSWAPFVFQFNPPEIQSSKKINYAIAPNIGGAYKKRYFSGFDSKEVTFTLVCLDMQGPTGVMEEIAYFEQLREPDPGILGGWFTLYGNQNYPPPQVLFQFGVSYVPLVWDVVDVQIQESHFHSGMVRGIMGFPKKCEVTMTLALVEDSILNQANQIAKKASMYAASAKSIVQEVQYHRKGIRKEMPGIFNTNPYSKY